MIFAARLLHLFHLMDHRTPAAVDIAFLLLFSAALVCAQNQPPQDTDLGKNGPENLPPKIGRGVSPPKVIYSPEAGFTERASKAGYQGTCVLGLIVDAKGVPRDIKVLRPLGMGLDEKAIEAVRSWRFAPAMKDGNPVAVQINVEVTFRLWSNGSTDFDSMTRKADSGDAEAQFKLSQVFLSTHDPADEPRGLSYLEKAAKQGIPKAQFALGEFYSSRRNDSVTAYVWYALAQRNHFKHSDKLLKELVKHMTPEQLADARHRLDSGIAF